MKQMFGVALILVLVTPASSSMLRTEMETMSPEDTNTIEEALAEASTEDDGKVSTQAMSQPKPAAVSEAPKVTPKLRASDKIAAIKNLQSASDVILQNGKSMSTSEFEDAIGNLFKIGDLGLTKEELDATPFGKSVDKIKTLIEDDMMPAVRGAHETDQAELKKLVEDMEACKTTKDTQWEASKGEDDTYKEWAPKHQSCRDAEAGIHAAKNACWEEEADKKTVMELKCQEFAVVEKKYEDQNQNKVVVTKGASESPQTYLTRISNTFCGQSGGDGEGGYGEDGFLDEFLKAKEACDTAVTQHTSKKTECEGLDTDLSTKTGNCNNMQDQMDGASCNYAIKIKDACEEYAECYNGRKTAYTIGADTVRLNEADRKIEWVGLKRMACLVAAFGDGKVTDEEITACKDAEHSVEYFNIDYPVTPSVETCEVPKLYPSTAEYKEEHFAKLPALAKGKEDANECTGVREISTQPSSGSPGTCTCERITLNGPYSTGPLVKCVDCLDVRRTQDKNSCPDGTKLFSPRSRSDWDTFLASTTVLRAPNFIVDVTRAQGTCEGCTTHAMNSDNTDVASWTTSDGSPWWLRSSAYEDAGTDYQADCYLDLFHPSSEDGQVTFHSDKCEYHAKSYYCQLIEVSTVPKADSPDGCLCEKVDLAGEYSAKALLKCTGCLDVSKSNQKNSCPKGTKLFAPASRTDWKTFLASASSLRNPSWIIDITRPQNGCGGCSEASMNSEDPSQATWGTADGSPWWLRSATHNQPSSDYDANCYMDVKDFGAGNEDTVDFEAHGCNFHSASYYCQIALAPVPPAPPPPPPPPPVTQGCAVKQAEHPAYTTANQDVVLCGNRYKDSSGSDSYTQACGSGWSPCTKDIWEARFPDNSAPGGEKTSWGAEQEDRCSGGVWDAGQPSSGIWAGDVCINAYNPWNSGKCLVADGKLKYGSGGCCAWDSHGGFQNDAGSSYSCAVYCCRD